MQQEVIQEPFAGWKNIKLPALIGADLISAGLSATLIAPVVTAIDRAVVENAASSKNPLLPTLKRHLACTFRHPKAFFQAKPFFIVWTLYAATYVTANVAETTTSTLMKHVDDMVNRSIIFVSTCVVNVPLGVWKDVRFVQIYGGSAPTKPASPSIAAKAATATVKAAAATSSIKPPVVKPGRVPKIVGATFLFRDALTIFGSFTLAPILSESVPTSVASDPRIKEAISQLGVPVLTQLVATPFHLLGLDLYRCSQSQLSDRISRIRSNLGPVTLLRCCRIIPAFGVGCIVNINLRAALHEKFGSE
ncbi:hypothetical protein BU24DRAFT_406115 [Aaosphaeria arxii CBS 175.79]|uniref:Sequence orphan n=1 Tax=Aaosphaeria arxii CBS 175.79 TaxID=1450172 RepID=A0A6A5Y2I5_9PLEO|nr:uncharacterized protein BU24DRAFT_406115 [Aaosphaeria arxii CBS 175.79]KAF2019446.1 hypothetical protein BU24DRAFT_406115 [Aaosphaeria arxii CBS 175.79]